MSTIKVEIQGSTAVVTPGFALWDELSTRKLRSEIDTLLENPDITKIILNLRHVSHLTSTVLAILMQTYASVQDTSRLLILCEVQKPVQNLFNVTQLDTILDIRPTLMDAYNDTYHTSNG